MIFENINILLRYGNWWDIPLMIMQFIGSSVAWLFLLNSESGLIHGLPSGNTAFIIAALWSGIFFILMCLFVWGWEDEM